MQQRGIIDLDFELSFGEQSISIALARETFHPDESTSHLTWVGSLGYPAFRIVVPTVPNGHIYESENNGTSAPGEPVFPTDGGTVLDNNIVWRDLGLSSAPPVVECAGGHRVSNAMPGSVITDWTLSTAYALGDFVLPTIAFEDPRRRAAVCIVAGTSDPVEPVWPDNQCDTIVDNGVTWLMLGDQANLAQYPFISELEITEDPVTVSYTLGGLNQINQTLIQEGRSFIYDGNDIPYGANSTISAAWCVAYVNKIITDPVLGFWYYPPIGYGLLTDDRTNAQSVNSEFTLEWDQDGIMRIR